MIKRSVTAGVLAGTLALTACGSKKPIASAPTTTKTTTAAVITTTSVDLFAKIQQAIDAQKAAIAAAQAKSDARTADQVSCSFEASRFAERGDHVLHRRE